ncbi:MAG: hypothetical protein MJB14_01915 [Spirochaetes bacterium]|nr:hypothetical protein [Spirochaetota bacterium]
MNQYKPDEILQFAIHIEENGKKFYLKMKDKFSQDQEINQLFTILADQEQQHRDYFQELLSAIQDYNNLDQYS